MPLTPGREPRQTDAPIILEVSADDESFPPEVDRLIIETRKQADGFVFVSGGASLMSDPDKERLLKLFEALTLLARGGVRFAVGDGGTRAGIMEGAGLARKASGNAFPLIGVAPAPDITTTGEPDKVPVDPHHSHVLAVRNDAWARSRRAAGDWTESDGHWGSETATMYRLFARLADGRPSVTVVANGGPIALDEVRANVEIPRRMILIEGSGRAADALVSMIKAEPSSDEEQQRLRARAETQGLPGRTGLYQIFDVNAGPHALATLLARVLLSGQA